MFSRTYLENILFIDIETASVAPTLDALDEPLRKLWARKADLMRDRPDQPQSPDQLFVGRAAIFAEFGKVVCISCGYIQFKDDRPHFKLKSFHGMDEAKLLADFAGMVNAFTARPDRTLCAHNGKEFDFPYLGRRYLINGLPLPTILAEIQTKKPWEIKLLDTMQLWKFGDFKSYTSLELLCAVFGVPTPKEDMDGSQVGRVYWEEGDHARIARYCERDVLATAQVLLRMCGQPLVAEEAVAWN